MTRPMPSAKDQILAAWTSPHSQFPHPVGKAGYALPNIMHHIWEPIGDPDRDNWLARHPDTRADAFSFDLRGAGNVFVLGQNCHLHGRVSVLSNNSKFIIGDHAGIGSGGRVNIFASSMGGFFFLGSKTSSNSTSFFLQGERITLIVGEDCMFAHGIVVRTSDDHAIVNISSGAFMNPPAGILIEPHVWLCPDSTVLRGAQIGFGSIVGVKSVVNGSLPRFSLAAGQPAIVRREGVSWDRPMIPAPHTHERLLQWSTEIAAPTE